MSLSTYSLTLGPGQNKTISATVTPDFSLSSGIYTSGLVASYDNVSTIGTFFLQVNTSPWYRLETVLPEILITVAAILAVSLFLVNWRKATRQATTSRRVPKPSPAVSLLVLLFFLIQQTGQSWAKCPGLPPPSLPPGGSGPDYYGIALDLATIAFFGLVAYFLIRNWRRGRAAKGSPAQPPHEPRP